MSTSDDPTVVDSPDGEYSVSVAETWLSVGVDEVAARNLPDMTAKIRIEESLTIVENAASENATPLQKKQAVRALAAEKLLTQDADRFMSSMQALDVSIDFDMDAKQSELTTLSNELMDVIRPDGQFVFRSY